MIKNVIAILFTVLFMGINSAPLIVIAIDDSIDISNFYSFSENDEEKKEKESEKTFEVFVVENSNESSSFLALKDLGHTEYHFKDYSKPHLYLISPPPEQNIL